MRKIAKLTRIAITPRLWQAACHGVAATVEHDAALEDYSFATVIDAGANKGQFAVYALFRWPRARVISFEPLPEPRAKLARVTGGRAEIHDCALGAETGETCMHIASRADSSSLLALGKRQKTIFKMEEVARLTVSVRRLDGCVGSDLPRPSLLRIDVQGYELEMLKAQADSCMRSTRSTSKFPGLSFTKGRQCMTRSMRFSPGLASNPPGCSTNTSMTASPSRLISCI